MRLFGLLRKKEKKTFEREFPLIGKMTCEATDESKCKSWKKTIDYMMWQGVELYFGDSIGDEKDLSTMIHQYELAIQNAKDIEKKLRADFWLCQLISDGEEPLKNVSPIEMSLHAYDYEGNAHPHIEISYDTRGGHIWIAIEDGEFSVFAD